MVSLSFQRYKYFNELRLEMSTNKALYVNKRIKYSINTLKMCDII